MPFVGDGGDRYGLQELHPVALGLLHEPVGQLGSADPVREPRVVVQPLGDARLPAEPLRVDHERLEVLPRRVDRGREPGRATAHDHQVVHVHHRGACQADLLGELLVRRLRQMRTVGEQERRDDPLAAVPLLDEPDPLLVAVDVVPVERDALIG